MSTKVVRCPERVSATKLIANGHNASWKLVAQHLKGRDTRSLNRNRSELSMECQLCALTCSRLRFESLKDMPGKVASCFTKSESDNLALLDLEHTPEVKERCGCVRSSCDSAFGGGFVLRGPTRLMVYLFLVAHFYLLARSVQSVVLKPLKPCSSQYPCTAHAHSDR